MADINDVARLFKERLRSDSPDQLKKAGDLWQEVPLSFYYTNRGGETIDIAVVEITKRIADDESLDLPEEVFENLADLIGVTTITKKAIRMIFLATLKPL